MPTKKAMDVCYQEKKLSDVGAVMASPRKPSWPTLPKTTASWGPLTATKFFFTAATTFNGAWYFYFYLN
jgi:hypothetical protein